jgi:hypothetical protein
VQKEREKYFYQTYHLRDAIIVNDPLDPIGVLRLLLPGGPFTFRMKNVTLAGGPVIPAAIFAPQHCGLPDTNMGNPPGAKCNVQVKNNDN